MSEAIYAPAGTLLGSLGGFLAAWLNIRAQDRRAEDEALIRTCLAFVARIMGVRRLCLQMEQAGFQEVWWNEAQALLGEAEGDLEHLN